jgi:probable O-glycosylation ligase (exosortase A-associated)
MRDLLVFAITMLLLPGSFRKPFLGLLLFSWLAYMRPQDLCWGFARTMRLSFFVGIAMIGGWFAYEKGKVAYAQWDIRTRAMLVLTMMIAVSYGFANVHDAYTNRYFFEYLKIIAVALFTTGQVTTKERFRTMVWTIALCLAFFGVKGGVLGVLGGGHQILRGPGGMMEDNNDFALALVMNVPLLWYMGIGEKRQIVLRATQVAVLLTVITIVLTHSRGAFLALSFSALWIAWRSGHVVRAGAALVALGLIFPQVAPKDVLDRLGTIGDTQETSTHSRLEAWQTALRMIEDNPLLGVGMRNFVPSVPKYTFVEIDPDSTVHVAHNSYLQVWAESGTPAFLVYMLLLGSVFVLCGRVYRIGRTRPDLAWAANYARMMEATTVGFMVGAIFLNRGHFDLIYHWLALVTSLGGVAYAAYREAPGLVTSDGAVGQHEVTVRWRPVAGLAQAGAASGSGVSLSSPAMRWSRRR